MKTPPIDVVLRNLRAARRRVSTQLFLTTLVKMGLLGGAALVIHGAVNRWLLGRMPWDAQVAAGVGLGALGLAVLITLARRRSLPEVAELVDRLGQTRDRFLTALDFSKAPEDGPMRAMAVEECVRFVGAGRFARLIPVRVPREAIYLLVPIVAVALLQWEAGESFAARQAETAAARSAVEDTARKLEELARQAEKTSEESKSDELKKIAEQLQRSAEELRANAKNPEEAEKSALREISALEQLVQEMQKSPPSVTPEEMKALAKALEENEATKEAAAEMAAGDLAKAAQELEKAMQKAEENKDERTPEEVRKALDEAVKKLAEKKQLSEAMQKLAEQMRKAAGGKGGQSSEAAKQLAQMLRQMAQGKTGQSSDSQNAQAMQQLLSALQNMKFGEGQSQPGGEPQPGQTPGIVMMEQFGKGDPGAMPAPGDPQQPSGQPGSERDTGTTDTPFGKDKVKPGENAQAQQITGRQGEGQSLQQSLTSAGDSSKSNRGYKDLYEAMAPAAQEAVLQENIPLGSRFFIKRYFEAIRPKE